MPRLNRCTALAVAAVVAVSGAAGCGESDEDKFNEEFSAINDDLLEIGRELGTAVTTARGKTDAQIARQFGALARRVESENRELKELDPPDDLKDELDDMTSGFDDISDSLEEIASAARSHDAQAARTATVELVGKAAEVNRAQNRLAEETGADKGSN